MRSLSRDERMRLPVLAAAVRASVALVLPMALLNSLLREWHRRALAAIFGALTAVEGTRRYGGPQSAGLARRGLAEGLLGDSHYA